MFNELPRLLTIEELGKLPTHRILSYKNKHFSKISREGESCNLMNQIKELLSKREHVERKGKK